MINFRSIETYNLSRLKLQNTFTLSTFILVSYTLYITQPNRSLINEKSKVNLNSTLSERAL